MTQQTAQTMQMEVAMPVAALPTSEKELAKKMKQKKNKNKQGKSSKKGTTVSLAQFLGDEDDDMKLARQVSKQEYEHTQVKKQQEEEDYQIAKKLSASLEPDYHTSVQMFKQEAHSKVRVIYKGYDESKIVSKSSQQSTILNHENDEDEEDYYLDDQDNEQDDEQASAYTNAQTGLLGEKDAASIPLSIKKVPPNFVAF